MTFLTRTMPAISLSSYSSHPIFMKFLVRLQNIKGTTCVSPKTFTPTDRTAKVRAFRLKAKSLLSVTLPFAQYHIHHCD